MTETAPVTAAQCDTGMRDAMRYDAQGTQPQGSGVQNCTDEGNQEGQIGHQTGNQTRSKRRVCWDDAIGDWEAQEDQGFADKTPADAQELETQRDQTLSDRMIWRVWLRDGRMMDA